LTPYVRFAPSFYGPRNLTPATTEETDSALALALTIARAAEDRKGDNIRLLKVGDVSYLADILSW
jgi:hypothetical protein